MRTSTRGLDSCQALLKITMPQSPKEIYIARKKKKFRQQRKNAVQLQRARRAQYLTETGRFTELVAEELPRVYWIEEHRK